MSIQSFRVHVVERNPQPGMPDSGWQKVEEFPESEDPAAYAAARAWARHYAHQHDEPARVVTHKLRQDDTFIPSSSRA